MMTLLQAERTPLWPVAENETKTETETETETRSRRKHIIKMPSMARRSIKKVYQTYLYAPT